MAHSIERAMKRRKEGTMRRRGSALAVAWFPVSALKTTPKCETYALTVPLDDALPEFGRLEVYFLLLPLKVCTRSSRL
jgi:hypothetical protein